LTSKPSTGAIPKVHVPSAGRTGEQALQLSELRLIAVDGTQLGVLPPPRALELAAQGGLQLVEVAPKASPPVWRLVPQQSIVAPASRRPVSAGKEPPAVSAEDAEPAEENGEEKRAAAVRKRASLGKKPRVKEVRLLDRCQEHDVVVKMKNAITFLGKGYVVKVTAAAVVNPDGSQQTDRARELVLRFVQACSDVATAGGLARSGRHVSTTLEPKVR
jgi:translation initiation factor IF-3